MIFVIGRKYELRSLSSFSKKERDLLEDYCLPTENNNSYGEILLLKKIIENTILPYKMSDGYYYPVWAFKDNLVEKLDVLLNDK